ncbi:hypothetical protein AB4Y35_23840 [Paraburkholderia sp. EG286A]|uniref:hypothetical protein n=1 Tax=unclassified Paraburkholderia TaxID=2615204 RepID=UPI0034D283C2
MAEAAIPQADVSAADPEWPCPEGEPAEYFVPPKCGEPNVFEIGLVLGGTVSAGTFTAGVLDFLFEALDEWDKARMQAVKDARGAVPGHRVRIRIVTGASGGGINAILAARALSFRFPHVREGVQEPSPSPNPFYQVWVNDIDIQKLLDTSDLGSSGHKGSAIISLLNGGVLSQIAQDTLGPTPAAAGDKPDAGYPAQALRAAGVEDVFARSWVYNPLAVVVTHTNLSGVPYSQMFRSDTAGASAEYFTNHADYVRLYFGYCVGENGAAIDPKTQYLPDSRYVGAPQTYTLGTAYLPEQLKGRSAADWPTLAQNVLGTSAFPIGFPARVVARHANDYAYRFVWDPVDAKYHWIAPLWPKVAPSGLNLNTYQFLSLDGGCTDNEPIMLATQVLEGLERAGNHHSVAGAEKADRAVVLVDPLCDPLPELLKPEATALVSLLSPTLQMFIRSNRFATADMTGFLRSDVYNRFLVAPKRWPRKAEGAAASVLVGGAALCAGGLGAFMGFFHRKFREHDFMLGRRNCQAFLAGTFTLAPENPVFIKGEIPTLPANWSGPRPPDPTLECPIIPLYGSAAEVQDQPEWPVDEFKPKSIEGLLKKRVEAMLSHLGDYLHIGKMGEALVAVVDLLVIAPQITKKILAIVSAELVRQRLLNPADAVPNGDDPMP